MPATKIDHNTLSLHNSNLSRKEIGVLVTAMQSAPGFSGATINEYEVYNQARRIIALRVNNEIAGIAAYKNFGKNWVEFSALIVLPKFRGQGLGRKLWQEAMQKFTGRSILAISANPLIKKNLALANGFEQKSFWQLPGEAQRYFILQKISWAKVKGLMSKQSAPMREFDFFVRQTDEL
ncbi:GNAT family N-acetyltransferase [Patescibacteria group bacterium]